MALSPRLQQLVNSQRKHHEAKADRFASVAESLIDELSGNRMTREAIQALMATEVELAEMDASGELTKADIEKEWQQFVADPNRYGKIT
ncbi:hypothetical protein REJC140_02390 [Pseudorhizobium endolithicum]|uniref:Uncharacterized protein n=1 Tax=Pseudorhizobium endolithicum TaxID=1191678 RepID=A0ABN7JJW2_9HYPH|nr:hypothetical protein REJC140_02390 [Pseudorhizobium endolithicum]